MLKLCNHSIRSIEFIAPYCFYLESWDIQVLQFHCYSKTWSGYVRLTKHIDSGGPKCNLLDAQTNPQGMGIPKEICITKQPHTLPQKMPQTMTKLQNSVYTCINMRRHSLLKLCSVLSWKMAKHHGRLQRKV